MKFFNRATLTVLSIGMFSALSFALPVLPFSEKGGLDRLQRSEYKSDFFKLANHFRTQADRMACGPTTGAIVLNALRYNTDKAPLIDLPKAFLDQMPVAKGTKFDPRLHAYTPENFMSEAAQKVKTLSRLYAEEVNGKRDPGLQLEQLRKIFEDAHKVNVKKIAVGTKETARNKDAKALPTKDYRKVVEEMKQNLKEADNYVVVNYARGELKQSGSGHISPVAAYDEKSDSFLVLDVNPFGGPWAWVDAKDLVNAMNTFDEEENRGVLFISEK